MRGRFFSRRKRRSNRRGVKNLSRKRCRPCVKPDELGIGPVFAMPKRLKRDGLRSMTSIFGAEGVRRSVPVLVDKLSIDSANYNVNAGWIKISHPYGMTGDILQRRGKWAVVAMCIASGQSAAGLFEIWNPLRDGALRGRGPLHSDRFLPSCLST